MPVLLACQWEFSNADAMAQTLFDAARRTPDRLPSTGLFQVALLLRATKEALPEPIAHCREWMVCFLIESNESERDLIREIRQYTKELSLYGCEVFALPCFGSTIQDTLFGIYQPCDVFGTVALNVDAATVTTGEHFLLAFTCRCGSRVLFNGSKCGHTETCGSCKRVHALPSKGEIPGVLLASAARRIQHKLVTALQKSCGQIDGSSGRGGGCGRKAWIWEGAWRWCENEYSGGETYRWLACPDCGPPWTQQREAERARWEAALAQLHTFNGAADVVRGKSGYFWTHRKQQFDALTPALEVLSRFGNQENLAPLIPGLLDAYGTCWEGSESDAYRHQKSIYKAAKPKVELLLRIAASTRQAHEILRREHARFERERDQYNELDENTYVWWARAKPAHVMALIDSIGPRGQS
jgi:hypothetical protein